MSIGKKSSENVVGMMLLTLYLSNDTANISKITNQNLFYRRSNKLIYDFYGIRVDCFCINVRFQNAYKNFRTIQSLFTPLDTNRTSGFEIFGKKKHIFRQTGKL